MASNNSNPANRQAKPNGYDTHTFDFLHVEPVLDIGDFVQGLLIDGSLAVIYGARGSGKTFFATTLALHVAAEKEFAGRRVEQGGVLYCSMEAGVGFKNRIVAWRDAMALDDANIPFVGTTVPVNLLDADATPLDSLVNLVLRMGPRMGKKTRLIVIDTLARAIAGGNENAPDDMGALVANADFLRQQTGACVLLVHHAGKDPERGARGHSMLGAAVDTEIEITDEDGNHTATVTKQRDLEAGTLFPFSLERVVLGQNRHGEDVSSCLVKFSEQPPPRRHPVKLGTDAKIGLRALDIAIGKAGELLNGPDMPNRVGVAIDAWRREFYSLKGAEPAANRQGFHRGQGELVAKNVITQKDNLVWFIQRDKSVTDL